MLPNDGQARFGDGRNLGEIGKRPRGLRDVDTLTKRERLLALLNDMPVAYLTRNVEPAPDNSMFEAAKSLTSFVRGNAPLLEELIYAHYKHAEREVEFDVGELPHGLSPHEVLSYVDDVELEVSRQAVAERPFCLSVTVRLSWDGEQGLHLVYWEGAFAPINEESGRRLAST